MIGPSAARHPADGSPQPVSASRDSATTSALGRLAQRRAESKPVALAPAVRQLSLANDHSPEEYVDLKTPYGPMRTYVLSPAAPGRYPRARAVLRDLPGDRSHPQDRRLSCRPRLCSCSAGNLPRAGGGSWCCPRLRHGGRRTRRSTRSRRSLLPTTRTPVPSWIFSPTTLVYRQAQVDQDLCRRPPFLPCRLQSRCPGRRLLLCHRYPQARSRPGYE